VSARSEVAARIRGLYGIADADASGGDPLGLAADLLAGGCRLVQLRCKGWKPEDVERAARELAVRCHRVGATLIVNDWPEIAVSSGSDGVHVGQLDASVEAVRAVVGEGRIIGRSTNDLDQLREALRGADYVAFGPVWETANAGRPKTVRGIDALRAARAAVPPSVPLVAIGGITRARAAEVRAAGASAWAVIGAIAHADDRIAATKALIEP
jgi:thiamine-phosphate diphosphorylase